jgi:DNA-binding transcriptional regulator YhcF (GntR family)
MTADLSSVPKYMRVAATVRDRIANGTLKPGSPAPSAAALSRATGYSELTCRKALRVLIADAALVPGLTRNARARVAGQVVPLDAQALADARRKLSAGLAARRRAAGLTQAELAALAGFSLTAIGHAETGRTWQSRQFWERVDSALDADGGLLCLYDACRAAAPAAPRREQQAAAGGPALAAVLGPVEPACVIIVWSDGRITTVHPPAPSCLPEA